MDAVGKVAELELAEKEKMKAKVAKILKHDINVFINRLPSSCVCAITHFILWSKHQINQLNPHLHPHFTGN